MQQGHWRDKKEWTRLGLPMSTDSDEACKLYDAILTQYARSVEDQSMGGLKTCVDKMLSADPDFVMGHVIRNGLALIGSGLNPSRDTLWTQRLDQLAKLANRPETTDREKLHVEALRLYFEGYLEKAASAWERILLKYPQDFLAVRFAFVVYISLGTTDQTRDSVARVLPHWNPTMPNYSSLFGLHGFALNETNLFQEAEKQSRKGLELDPNDGWATHALAHIMEMQGRQDEGISFMGSTVKEWEAANMLACHNYWHWALFHVEKTALRAPFRVSSLHPDDSLQSLRHEVYKVHQHGGLDLAPLVRGPGIYLFSHLPIVRMIGFTPTAGDYQAALDIYDAEVGPRTLSKNVLPNMVNTTSLLFRLELEGVNVGDRWQALFESARPHIDDNSWAFADPHILLSCLKVGEKDTASKMMDGLAECINKGDNTYADITKTVGQTLCQSLIAYNDGDYEEAVDLLYPKRYLVYRIGGSVAQRDMFNLFLIQACIKSASKNHHRIARQLLFERKELKQQAPMTDRLMTTAMCLPVD